MGRIQSPDTINNRLEGVGRRKEMSQQDHNQQPYGSLDIPIYMDLGSGEYYGCMIIGPKNWTMV